MIEEEISLEVTTSDKFLSMPFDAQTLYFRLALGSSDDGIVGFSMVKEIMQRISVEDSALDTLSKNGFTVITERGIRVRLRANEGEN